MCCEGVCVGYPSDLPGCTSRHEVALFFWVIIELLYVNIHFITLFHDFLHFSVNMTVSRLLPYSVPFLFDNKNWNWIDFVWTFIKELNLDLRLNGLCDRSNLVDLEKQTVTGLHIDSPFDTLRVGYSQIITNDLDISRTAELGPGCPVILVEAILNRHNYSWQQTRLNQSKKLLWSTNKNSKLIFNKWSVQLSKE